LLQRSKDDVKHGRTNSEPFQFSTILFSVTLVGLVKQLAIICPLVRSTVPIFFLGIYFLIAFHEEYSVI